MSMIDLRHFARALSSGNRWIASNVEVDKLTAYIHYALYALERYESLREADLAGRGEPLEKTDDSQWYNQGAKYLLRTQNSDGSWESKSGLVPDTCFGALFLMGSTRKSLTADSVVRYKSGTLIGGQGFPAARPIRIREGQVVVRPLDAPLEQALAILGDPAHPDYAAAVELLADAAREYTPRQLIPHARALRRLALESERDVRYQAIQCLCRTRDLDHVPWLIHLLGDGDPQVALCSAQALGELSRKFETLGFSPQSTPRERDMAIDRWKA